MRDNMARARERHIHATSDQLDPNKHNSITSKQPRAIMTANLILRQISLGTDTPHVTLFFILLKQKE